MEKCLVQGHAEVKIHQEAAGLWKQSAQALESGGPEFQSYLCYLSAGCPWMPHFPSACLSLHTCERDPQSALPRVSVKIQCDSVHRRAL